MFNIIETNKLTLSLRNGLYMPFVYKGRQIVVHNASWSFREKIWVDDELVVDQSRYARVSTHDIDVDDDRLTITFGYREGFNVIFIEVRSGDIEVYEHSHRIGKKVETKKFVAIVLTMAIAGAVLGYGLGTLARILVGGS